MADKPTLCTLCRNRPANPESRTYTSGKNWCLLCQDEYYNIDGEEVYDRGR